MSEILVILGFVFIVFVLLFINRKVRVKLEEKYGKESERDYLQILLFFSLWFVIFYVALYLTKENIGITAIIIAIIGLSAIPAGKPRTMLHNCTTGIVLSWAPAILLYFLTLGSP